MTKLIHVSAGGKKLDDITTGGPFSGSGSIGNAPGMIYAFNQQTGEMTMFPQQPDENIGDTVEAITLAKERARRLGEREANLRVRFDRITDLGFAARRNTEIVEQLVNFSIPQGPSGATIAKVEAGREQLLALGTTLGAPEGIMKFLRKKTDFLPLDAASRAQAVKESNLIDITASIAMMLDENDLVRRGGFEAIEKRLRPSIMSGDPERAKIAVAEEYRKAASAYNRRLTPQMKTAGLGLLSEELYTTSSFGPGNPPTEKSVQAAPPGAEMTVEEMQKFVEENENTEQLFHGGAFKPNVGLTPRRPRP